VGALDEPARHAARPIVLKGGLDGSSALPWERRSSKRRPVPEAIARKRPDAGVVCVTPWTTMEVHVSGRVHQCCSTWTVGERGSVLDEALEDIWNGPGYRGARRLMAGGGGEGPDALCHTICPRLHDRQYEERRFEILDGAEPFVRNQLLLAEELAERREQLRARPLYLAICPSTYCNYDCIMCVHGRTPRRDLRDSLWEELPALLPTLRTLTLLGGEPLANPAVMRFLREWDLARYPDAAVDLVTNGSLLTAGALKHLGRCRFGDVTVSLNAGTPEVYERVQRGVALDEVMANVDALVAHRREHGRWFGISLSFVVQTANAHTLLAFGELAHARDLRIRLSPLNPRGTGLDTDALDYYDDPDAVARALAELDRFDAWATRARPEWREEIRATRDAIAGEHAARLGRAPTGMRLPIVS
jgi:MoaA/NifB/PqqE/SkfB family radical SAM enzyme